MSYLRLHQGILMQPESGARLRVNGLLPILVGSPMLENNGTLACMTSGIRLHDRCQSLA